MPSILVTLAALPWLQGFFEPEGVVEQGSRDVVAELANWREPAEECAASAYGGLRLSADVSEAKGTEEIIASYTQGVFVLAGDRRLIAQAPPFECEGSADELIAIAAGNAAIGTPVIALAASSGGRTASVTWLTLYRVATDGVLQPIFAGEVERHHDDTTRTGIVTLVPGGLVHRDPQGTLGIWIYDAKLGRYIEQTTTRSAI
jgi:hypothetical protein